MRSATRLSPAAYWASWADRLPMIRARHPAAAAFIRQSLDLPPSHAPSASGLQELRAAREVLTREGFVGPTWDEIWNGARPRPPADAAAEPGEWTHGWQFYAASALDESSHAAALAQPWSDAAGKALLRSQSGPGAGRVFTVLPTSPSTTLSSAELRVLLLRRLHLRLPLAVARCSCGRPLDARGHRRAACSTCGVLRRRANPQERAVARICREAGARAAENVMLRDMNLQGISARDCRQLEVVANGFPL